MIISLKRLAAAVAVIALVAGFVPGEARALEVSGYVALEGRAFFNDPLHQGQVRDSGSVVTEPEFYHDLTDGLSLTFVPFARLDSADDSRTHLDVRELNLLLVRDKWEARVGVGKVFWGVTEFVHLVDVINQTDAVESLDGEVKLGQPMVQITVPADWGTLEFFVLPFFRERTFPGRQGRLRPALPVDASLATYEHAEGNRHVDFAARYSHTLGNWDFGIYNFHGTNREPTLLIGLDGAGRLVLMPYYEQINQTGLDLQGVVGNWLLKLEALYRTGQDPVDFTATVLGLEYTITNIAQTGMDLGLVAEWAWDERGADATMPFQNDLMLGARFSLGDAAGTELLLGLAQDLDYGTRALSLEGSRRLGSRMRLRIESRVFVNTAPQSALMHAVRDDDFVALELAWYL